MYMLLAYYLYFQEYFKLITILLKEVLKLLIATVLSAAYWWHWCRILQVPYQYEVISSGGGTILKVGGPVLEKVDDQW